MTNRIFTHPANKSDRLYLDLVNKRFDGSFRFAGERFLAYCSNLDQKLLELEQRANIQQALKPDSNVKDQNKYGCRIPELELPTSNASGFEASGFETDFEIDVRRI